MSHWEGSCLWEDVCVVSRTCGDVDGGAGVYDVSVKGCGGVMGVAGLLRYVIVEV